MRLKGETVGTFTDAVYAIAVTILALEIPGDLPGRGLNLGQFSDVLLEYAVAFLLLFVFWLQHRRITGLVDVADRLGLLINAIIMMMVCLIPRATKFVFDYGDDVTLGALGDSLIGKGWTRAELVDLFYVVVVVIVDLGIMSLLWVNGRQGGKDEVAHLKQSKRVVTISLLVVLSTSFLLPVENRYFLLIVPLMLFFEDELTRLMDRFKKNA